MTKAKQPRAQKAENGGQEKARCGAAELRGASQEGATGALNSAAVRRRSRS